MNGSPLESVFFKGNESSTGVFSLSIVSPPGEALRFLLLKLAVALGLKVSSVFIRPLWSSCSGGGAPPHLPSGDWDSRLDSGEWALISSTRVLFA